MLMEVAPSDLNCCCVIHQPMFSTFTLTCSNLVMSEFRLFATPLFFGVYNLNLVLVRSMHFNFNIGPVMDLVV